MADSVKHSFDAWTAVPRRLPGVDPGALEEFGWYAKFQIDIGHRCRGMSSNTSGTSSTTSRSTTVAGAAHASVAAERFTPDFAAEWIEVRCPSPLEDVATRLDLRDDDDDEVGE